ncbi:MAG TPA: thioredoxin family protein [Mucilaginibacter sp.]|nr:thioredoxin family protein [Mucilaginibacter sp.]
MKKILFLALIVPLLASAQNKNENNSDSKEKGIKFTQDLAWTEIKQKAKTENKYIFVDAFATWCGPCKAMDANIYPNRTVGKILNQKFISVKVQMDRTNKDNEQVRSWYNDAQMLMDQNKVEAFPTFLFFSPNGRLVHKSEGYRDTTAFIELVNFATDPKRLKFYADLDDYKNGKRDYAAMPGLIKTLTELSEDKKAAEEIARDYKTNYLDKLSNIQLLTRENIEFIFEHLRLINSTSDRFFRLFFNYPNVVDSLHNQKGAALYFINYRIAKDEIWKKMFINDTTTIPVNRNPDWTRIHKLIKTKFGESFANNIIPDSKILFYRRIKEWITWASLQDAKLDSNPPKAPKPDDNYLASDTWNLNDIAWEAFLYCDIQSVLQRALHWSDLSIILEQPNPNIQFLDTRANLLYKMGRVKEAIAQEEEAIQLDTENAKKNGKEKGGFVDNYSETVTKMKKGLRTWPEQ